MTRFIFLFLVLAAGGAIAQTRIVFATDWKAEAEHGGFYQALAKGYYKQRGLDVQLRQGGPAVNIPQLMAAGAIDLGVGSSSFIALNLAREKAGVRAVMACFQKDPQVLIAHPDPAIQSLADLKGRPILISDATIGTFWKWLEFRFGYSPKQIRKYSYSLVPFLNDPNAVQQGYVTSEPYLIEKQGGFTPKVFLLANEGYPAYASLILARQAWIDQKPEIIQAFVDATIEGWRDYLKGDSGPGDALMRKDNPDASADLLANGRKRLIEDGVVMSGDSIGAMTDERWKAFRDVMVSTKVYDESVDFHSAYTLQFIGRPK